MGKTVSLFSGYSQKENRTTNYCLLILKMLYEENPRFLAEVLELMIGEDLSAKIGVTFKQQEKKNSSIPDGIIIQEPLEIFLETKNYDWFYDSQLENHLESFRGTGLRVLIALGKFDNKQINKFENIQKICEANYKNTIKFKTLSFNDFISALESLEYLPKNLADSIKELRNYLDENGLLDSWETQLDVVNCAMNFKDIENHKVYFCPVVGGAYSHKRCKFFGMYKNKTVSQIAEIKAVIDIIDNKAIVNWNNIHDEDNIFEKEAVDLAEKLKPHRPEIRVFLLGELFATNFRKDSLGGMQGSKQYFNIEKFKINSAQELAKALYNKNWSNF